MQLGARDKTDRGLSVGREAPVSQDGMSDAGEMHAQLVLPPGMRPQMLPQQGGRKGGEGGGG